MSRCCIKRGIWVVRQCENAALTTCSVCGTPACTEHLSVNAQKKFTCINCLQDRIPIYAIDDFKEGDVENYIYYLASLKLYFNELLQENETLGIKPIPIERLYNFTHYDVLSFRQEYVQYYDDNDTSANLYDS